MEERCVYSLIHPWASRIVPSPNCHNKKKLLHKAAPQDFECLYAFLLLLLLSRASSSTFAILIVGVHKVPRELFLRVATIFPFLYPIARRYRLEVLHFDSNLDPFFYICVCAVSLPINCSTPGLFNIIIHEQYLITVI